MFFIVSGQTKLRFVETGMVFPVSGIYQAPLFPTWSQMLNNFLETLGAKDVSEKDRLDGE